MHWPASIWPITWESKYARYVVEISMPILVFIIDFFQFFKIFPKITNTLFWAHSAPFLPKFGPKMNFPGRKSAPSVLQYSNYLPLWQKLEKPNEPFLRKLLDGHTKNQFISLISLWDTSSFRVLQLIEQSHKLIGQEHFGPYLRNQSFPKMKFTQAYKSYSNINFHYRRNW